MNIPPNSEYLQIPEQLRGKIKKVGELYNEPILYGDPNLLKPNDLYYIITSEQVYRYIGINNGSDFKFTVIDANFDLIKNMMADKHHTLAEQQLNKSKCAGYLFNDKIYTGDPNVIKRGNLYYDPYLPLIGKIGYSPIYDAVKINYKFIIEAPEIPASDTGIINYSVNYKSRNFGLFEDMADARVVMETTFAEGQEFVYTKDLIVEIPIQILNRTIYNLRGSYLKEAYEISPSMQLDTIRPGKTEVVYKFHPEIGEYILGLLLYSGGTFYNTFISRVSIPSFSVKVSDTKK